MGGMFSKPAMPVIPEPKPPAPMPDSESPAVMEAKRRQQMEIMSRAGRTSTILSAPEGRGGGGESYSSKQLGASR